MSEPQAPRPATIRAVLDAQAAHHADAPFVIAPEARCTLTYSDLAQQTRRLEAFLDARGIARGERVALYLHNGYQTAALFIGMMAAGRVVAPLNLLSQRSQLTWVLRHCAPRLVFTCAAHAGDLAAAMADVPDGPDTVVIDIDDPGIFEATAPTASASRHDALPDDIALNTQS